MNTKKKYKTVKYVMNSGEEGDGTSIPIDPGVINLPKVYWLRHLRSHSFLIGLLIQDKSIGYPT